MEKEKENPQYWIKESEIENYYKFAVESGEIKSGTYADYRKGFLEFIAKTHDVTVIKDD